MRPTLLALVLCAAFSADAQLELTIFHANDGESALTGYGDEGGAHRFIEVLRRERFALQGKPSLTISSGDNYLAGRQIAASINSLQNDPARGQFYDAALARAIGYDAVVIGNHEFDFGPQLLGSFIEHANIPPTHTRFLTANLDFSNSTQVTQAVKDLVDPIAVFDIDGTLVGVVAATTPMLPSISNPGDVAINTDVRAVVQQQIDTLTAGGVNIIILASHLQSVSEDAKLIAQLHGVDFAIAGGGDELLANADTPLVPSHAHEKPMGAYPLTEVDTDGDGTHEAIVNADGARVPVVTTSGQFRYLGRITLHFDAAGVLTATSNPGPVRVVDASTGLPDGVKPDVTMLEYVVKPVAEFSAELDQTTIGKLGPGVTLDGRRTEVRFRETGFGNLIADAVRHRVEQEFNPAGPIIGLQNAGGIRNDVVLEPGDTITMGNTFDALPFPNFVCLVRDVSVETLRQSLENSVSRVEHGDGRLLQISGFSMTYDPAAPGSTYDRDGKLVKLGSRVRSVVLDDGTVLIQDSKITKETTIAVALIDFTARGGDQHDFGPLTAARFSRSPTTYQQAVANYIEHMGGTITAKAYAQFGEGRIRPITAPAD